MKNVAVLLALIGLRVGSALAGPVLPGRAPQHRWPGADAARQNRPCEGCHVAIAREWRASYHRLAYRDPAVAMSSDSSAAQSLEREVVLAEGQLP